MPKVAAGISSWPGCDELTNTSTLLGHDSKTRLWEQRQQKRFLPTPALEGLRPRAGCSVRAWAVLFHRFGQSQPHDGEGQSQGSCGGGLRPGSCYMWVGTSPGSCRPSMFPHGRRAQS